jgi:hypothetical protein
VGVLLALIIFVAVVSAIGFAAWACLNWVLGPLDRAAKNRRYPIQFALADLLCLFVLIQLPIGLIHWAVQNAPRGGLVIFDVVLGAMITLLWWICLRTLSRAGIHVVWQRCLVLTLVMPGAYVGNIALIFLPFVAGKQLLEHELATAGWLLLVELILLFILYGFSRFTRSIVASAKGIAAPENIQSHENSREPTARGEQ